MTGQFKDESTVVQVAMDKDTIVELYDFISTHLDVVNDTPNVEALMMELEDLLDD